MNDDTVIRTLRAMAWERAMGEMKALLNTYWGESEKFEGMKEALDKFKKEVTDNGWAE